MTITNQILTAGDLLKMSGEQRYELVRGELHTMPPAGFDHGAVVSNLQYFISRHVREQNLGTVVGAETGFLLFQNPDTVRGVDVGFVSAHRVPNGARDLGYFHGAPDLAVEVISPGDTYSEVEQKVADYLIAGTREVWVVNPRRQSVTVHRPNQNPAVFTNDQTIGGGDLLPGFTCPVSEIFR